MDISDLIPLIVIVGSLIYSVITNTGKKKKEQMAKTTLPGKTDVEFPTILENENYADVVFEEKEIRKETTKKHHLQKKKNNLPKTAPVLIEENEFENFSFDFDNEDEIKKAIIYSEIFNRKEY